MKSKIVVFDLGKVLVDFDYSIAARRIASQSASTIEKLHTFLGSSPILIELESGRMTREQFFRQVQAATGYRGGIGEFSEFFADIFTEIPEMVQLHADLRQCGLKTYIFSNTNDLAVEHIQRNFPFFQNFDGYIYSYEVGAMKPEPAIYEALEELAGRHGAEIVYLDDRPENIAGGLARSWQAILHETPEKSRAKLMEFLK